MTMSMDREEHEVACGCVGRESARSVLEAIYEEDFLGFSYGFRPGRGQHDALDALRPIMAHSDTYQ
jgi:hypothetical protein